MIIDKILERDENKCKYLRQFDNLSTFIDEYTTLNNRVGHSNYYIPDKMLEYIKNRKYKSNIYYYYSVYEEMVCNNENIPLAAKCYGFDDYEIKILSSKYDVEFASKYEKLCNLILENIADYIYHLDVVGFNYKK